MSWRRNWEEVIPFFHYPQEIRTIIYTINVLENVNMRIRKIIKNRGHFPGDEAATKIHLFGVTKYHAQMENCPIYMASGMPPICHIFRREI